MKRSKSNELTNEQIKDLAEIICCSGDEPKEKSIALLLLTDEILRNGNGAAMHAKDVAFSRYAELDGDIVDAQVNLLRAELK